MKKWRCLVCDLIYDEEQGWPDDGIAPGTRWEDVPQDWVCPYCGVGKEDFEMVEIKSAAVAAAGDLLSAEPEYEGDPLVIVGAGMAAYNLAKEFRKYNTTTPIKIVSRDDGSLYYKPSLSTGLSDGKTPDELVMRQELAAEVLPFSEVSAIDRDNKTVTINGDVVSYSKLVLAMGADVIRAPFSGDGVDCIHSVNDLLDYRKFRADLVGKSKVIIIGAGLIGCEFANDLLNKGFEVEIVDTFAQCMPALLPEVAAAALQQALTSMGCRFHFGSKVEAINKDDDQLMVSLSGGALLHADVVVSAIGLRPRIELAKQAGLEVEQGIIVDRYLQTSDDNIYALGDCAQIENHVLMYVEPLLVSARALAQTLSGQPTPVRFDAMPVVIKTPACPIVVAPPGAQLSGQWHIEADNGNVTALFKNEQGDNLGFVLTGSHIDQRKALQQTLPALIADQ